MAIKLARPLPWAPRGLRFRHAGDPPPVPLTAILVTGATDGLGRATAEELAGRGARVLVHGRNAGRAETAVSELGEASGKGGLAMYVADLSSLAEVRRLAEEIERREERLDVLINNAGVFERERGESADGHELTFAVNYLAGFLLTNLLLPLLARSAPARVVNVASIGQTEIDFGDVMLERGYEGYRAYAQSKLAQVMFSFELHERLRARGAAEVTVNALHPATLMDTKMVRDSFGRAQSRVAEGVEATARLAADPDLDGVSGRFFDGTAESHAHDQAYDAEARRRRWQLSSELTGCDLRL